MGKSVLGQWGGNGVVGHNASRSSPVLVDSGENNWKMLSGGGRDNSGEYGIKTDGTLWSWGYNYQGSLGYPNSSGSSQSSPTQVGTDTTWAQVGGGHICALAVKTDGTLWGWGNNGLGNLGHNNETAYDSPRQVGTDTTWNGVSCAYRSVCATKTNGTLWTWGYNDGSCLGQNNNTNYSSPTQVGAETDWVRASARKGTYMFASKNSSAAVGRYLDKQGELWSWGTGSAGVTGQGNETTLSSPKQVGTDATWDILTPIPMSGLNVSLHTKANGSLWAWGNGNDGKLGLNAETSYSSPKQLPGTTWSSGYNAYSSGINGHSGAVKTTGQLYVWGTNGNGSLGQNDRNERSSPVQIPGTYGKIHAGSQFFVQVTRDSQ
jgi:hypothetical protein